MGGGWAVDRGERRGNKHIWNKSVLCKGVAENWVTSYALMRIEVCIRQNHPDGSSSRP